MQFELPLLPATVPGKHVVQLEDLVVLAKVPGEHKEQDPDPATLNCPTEHSVQFTAPFRLNVPAVHSSHCTVSLSVVWMYPAEQDPVQFLELVEPAGDVIPPSHAVQSLDPVLLA